MIPSMFGRVALLCVLLTPVLPAQRPQAPEANEARAALAPVSRLLGRWEGEAKVQSGPGGPMTIRQYEDVVFGAGSTVLMIRGTGISTDPATPHDTVFEAAATIWYDPAARRLRMRAHRAEGVAVDAEIEVLGDSVTWGFPVTGGRVRYVIDFPGGEWREVGHFLREGAAPVQFIEMRLKRIAK
jgi:hypothetical protein